MGTTKTKILDMVFVAFVAIAAALAVIHFALPKVLEKYISDLLSASIDKSIWLADKAFDKGDYRSACYFYSLLFANDTENHFFRAREEPYYICAMLLTNQSLPDKTYPPLAFGNFTQSLNDMSDTISRTHTYGIAGDQFNEVNVLTNDNVDALKYIRRRVATLTNSLTLTDSIDEAISNIYQIAAQPPKPQ